MSSHKFFGCPFSLSDGNRLSLQLNNIVILKSLIDMTKLYGMFYNSTNVYCMCSANRSSISQYLKYRLISKKACSHHLHFSLHIVQYLLFLLKFVL